MALLPIAFYLMKRCNWAFDTSSTAEDADALVLVTEWKQFARLDLAGLAKRMTRAILVDGRNLFDPEAARAAGFDYCGIGRRQRAAHGGGVSVPAAQVAD